MQTRVLGPHHPDGGLPVSLIGLGTMTFGEQTSQDEAFAIMDLALERGVTHFDAAELYPITPRAETQGRTEEIIGAWLKARGTRGRVTLASKVVGRSPDMAWFRGAEHRLDRANIAAAVDASLRRLGVECIDLYYLHWPDRKANYFGKLGYDHDPAEQDTPLEDSLAALAEQVAAGKIRHVGLSNETPWGLHRCLTLAATAGLPRVSAIQNPYSLLNRSFEVGLAEMAIREQVPLMAYSPLGGGVLTGKYEGGARPDGSRLALWPARYGRYTKPRGLHATDEYIHLARRHHLDPAHLAIAFCASRPFMGSVLVGASTLEQWRHNLEAVDLALSPGVLSDIEVLHDGTPYPAP